MKRVYLNLFILVALAVYLYAIFGLDIFPGARQVFTPKDLSDTQCQSDSDCTPLPICRPQHCINKNSVEKYRLPTWDGDGRIRMPIPSNDSWLQNNPGCLKMYYGPQVEERTADVAADCVCRQLSCVNLKQFFSAWRFGKFIPFGRALLLLPLILLSSGLCKVNLNSWKIGNHFAVFLAGLLIYVLVTVVLR